MSSTFSVTFVFILVASMEAEIVKRSPLNIGSNSRTWGTSSRKTYDSYSSNAANTSSAAAEWKGNPIEYTIGGVLSGSEGIDHYFTQILSVSFY